MNESGILTEIRNTLGRLPNVRLFRNSVGKLQDKEGRWVAFGLCVGSSDAIGWTSVTVTPDMVGRKIAVFTAIETKIIGDRTAPKRREQQQNFINAVQAAGGYAGIARTLEQAEQICRTQTVTNTAVQHSPLPLQPKP